VRVPADLVRVPAVEFHEKVNPGLNITFFLATHPILVVRSRESYPFSTASIELLNKFSCLLVCQCLLLRERGGGVGRGGEQREKERQRLHQSF
jgi:hypothetical protein